tara:strand:+ start:1494 stop:1685 length:192 start_codon:yes stop_codon:yes gene_type:complete
MDLINGEVILTLQIAWISSIAHATKGLVVSGVGDKTSDGSITTGVLENLFENRSNLCKVASPT